MGRELVNTIAMVFALLMLPIHFGAVRPPALTQLEQAWRDTAAVAESAYCVTRWATVPLATAISPPDSITAVFAIRPAPIDSATRDAVRGIRCGADPVLHTHVPMAGGWYDCQPSRADREALAASAAPFAVVQCGPEQFVFYFRADWSASP